MFVGICRLLLLAPDCHSLKEKRQVIRTLKDKIRSRFDVKLSEVGGQDTWQRIELGFAVVTGEQSSAEQAMERVVAHLDGLGLARLINQRRELVSLPSPHELPIEADDWIPPEWEDES